MLASTSAGVRRKLVSVACQNAAPRVHVLRSGSHAGTWGCGAGERRPLRTAAVVTTTHPRRPLSAAAAVPAAKPSQTGNPGIPRFAQGLLNLMGWNRPKNVRIRSATALFRACQQQAERKAWHTKGMIGEDFRSRHTLISTHVWIMHKRLLKEDKEGRDIQETLFDELWNETTRRLRALGIGELSINRFLKEVQQYAFGAMIDYDRAIESEDKIQALSEAVRRNIYLKDDAPMPEEHSTEVARYIARELETLMLLPREAVLSGRVAFGDLPAWSAVKRSGGGGGPAVAAAAAAEATRVGTGQKQNSGSASAEKEAAEAAGDDEEWREALTEGGKLYYWNTRTRESRWSKP